MRDPTAAGLSKQEAAGLVIAAAAHVALLVVLSLAPPGKTVKPPPERMEVTFSEEISDQSTSPDPMAQAAPDVAPELGEPQPEPVTQPQPLPEPPKPVPAPPQPQPKPRPVPAPPMPAPRPQPKPAPQRPTPAKPLPAKPAPAKPAPPKAAPAKAAPAKPGDTSPRRRPDSPAGGSRIGTDFLKGIPGSAKPGTAKTPAAAVVGPEVKASLASAVARQVKAHWSGPQGVDIDKLVTVLAWELNPDGTLVGRPRLVSQTGVTPSNEAQAKRHVELAIRAVQLAAPFDLPEEYYGNWKRVGPFRFDKRLSQ